MNEKVYGVTKNTLNCEIHRYQVDNILKDSVSVVSVEELEEWVDEHLDACAGVDASDLVEWAKQKAAEEKE